MVKNLKGQIKVEFIFGIFVFSLVILFAGAHLKDKLSSILTDSRIDSLKAEGISIVNVLVRDKGYPEDWESDPRFVKILGLAHSPYNLSRVKINTLNSNCTLFEEKFGIIGYRLIINTTHQILSCGGVGGRIKVSIEVPVVVENEKGKLILELW
jgi:hypothetical protein